MKKLYMVSAMLLFVLPLCFAQNFLPKGTYRSPFENGMNGMTAIGKNGGIRGQRFLTSIVGYENYVVPSVSNANAALLGLDFMYRRNSGFTVWFNNALLLGSVDYITREYRSYPYYSSYLFSRSGFVYGWAGEFLLGYSKTAGRHQFDFGAGLQTAFGFGDALLAELAALAFRFDYACFFNGKVGITACITDGLGYGMVGNSPGFINAFSVKLGPIFKL